MLLGPKNSWSCESSSGAIFKLRFQSISVGMAPNVELISVNAELNIVEASESDNEEKEEEEDEEDEDDVDDDDVDDDDDEDDTLCSINGTNAMGSS